MDWLPTLSEGSGPVYRRIVDALSNDIASGRLRRGATTADPSRAGAGPED